MSKIAGLGDIKKKVWDNSLLYYKKKDWKWPYIQAEEEAKRNEFFAGGLDQRG